jgi:beta-fructofuranosidase
MGIGSGIARKGGCVLLYRSQDLRNWEYLHPLLSGEWNGGASGNPVESGEMWECPDFFALGGKHVLLYSTEGKVYWFSGEYDAKEHRFHPQQKGELDYGGHAYYAPKSMLDEHGNRILWGWITETRPEVEYSRAGWAGVMSLPRVLTLNAEGQLEMRVVPRVNDLRSGGPIRWPADEHRIPCPLDPAKGHCVELPLRGLCAEFELRAQSAAEMVHIVLGLSSKPALTYQLDPGQGSVAINANTLHTGLPKGEMRARLFLDGSVVELFVNERFAFTNRVYDLDPEHATLRLYGSSTAISDASLWQMRPISPDRLTS